MKIFFKKLIFSLGKGREWGFFLFILSSCTSFNKLSNQNLAGLYDSENSYLHPQFTVFHYREDSSKLFVRISADELLYKKNEAGIVEAQFTISYRLFSSFESKEIIDSATVVVSNYDPDNSSGAIVHTLNFKTPETVNYILQVEVKDNNRQQSFLTLLVIEKSGRQSAQRFLLKLKNQNVPLFRNYVAPEETFNILTTDGEPKKMFVRCYFRDFPLAAPPFAQRIPVRFEYAADSIFTIEISPSTEIRLEKKGFYHFQLDSSVKQGLTVFCFDEDFPKITDAFQLIEALRYLTTKNEYDKLLLSRDKKSAIDNYWLELAGNQERAKVLIRKYYTRIQEANKLFTSYLEGWKTDRGLIYTIFGPPTSVFRTTESEDWTYGNFNSMNSLTFTFEKIYNPFSVNDYILRRSDFYENSWYRAVDRWREGVVIND